MERLINEFNSQYEDMEQDLIKWKEKYFLKIVLENMIADECKDVDIEAEYILKFIKLLEKTSIEEHKLFARLKRYNITDRNMAKEITSDLNLLTDFNL